MFPLCGFMPKAGPCPTSQCSSGGSATGIRCGRLRFRRMGESFLHGPETVRRSSSPTETAAIRQVVLIVATHYVKLRFGPTL